MDGKKRLEGLKEEVLRESNNTHLQELLTEAVENHGDLCLSNQEKNKPEILRLCRRNNIILRQALRLVTGQN